MSTPYLPGKFVWFELLTQNIDQAIKFYDGLFGWRSARVSMGSDEPYPMINNGEQGIGGYRQGRRGEEPLGFLPLGTGCRRLAQRRGGRGMPHHDGADRLRSGGAGGGDGRPDRSILLRMEGRQRRPARRRKAPTGSWVWNRLWTSNDHKALAFYETMFGSRATR
jgi:predicted enzyme related to lactoylglutathione lyase